MPTSLFSRPFSTLSAVLLSIGFTMNAQAGDPAQEGLAIALKNDQANQGFGTDQSIMEMVLINAHGDKTTRRMLSETLEGKDEGDKSVATFQWPADVKGTKMLTHTKKVGDDQQWLFLPAIKRVKRISSKNKSGSFMGSEFSYEDLGSQEVEKFTYSLIGDATHDGRSVWHMTRIPKDKRSGYSKQVVWVDKEYHSPLKMEYYDRKGDLLKTATFRNYSQFGTLWRVGEIHMHNAQTQKQSIITWKKRKVGVELDTDIFDSSLLAD